MSTKGGIGVEGEDRGRGERLGKRGEDEGEKAGIAGGEKVPPGAESVKQLPWEEKQYDENVLPRVFLEQDGRTTLWCSVTNERERRDAIVLHFHK